MRGAGGSLSAQWETTARYVLKDTYIYMYPAGSDAYVECRAVFGGAGKSGSVQFDLQMVHRAFLLCDKVG